MYSTGELELGRGLSDTSAISSVSKFSTNDAVGALSLVSLTEPTEARRPRSE
jgi:hypothetical protein